jgi:hypothetical protein
MVYLTHKISDRLKPGESYSFLTKTISIVPQNDGTIVISAFKLDKKFIDELNSIGSKIDGTLSVTLDSGVKVISHNASSEPSLFGLLGSYKWQIKSPDVLPRMVIKIK